VTTPSSQAYIDDVTYQIPITLDNRVPVNGILRIEVPNQVSIMKTYGGPDPDLSASTAFTKFVSIGPFTTDFATYG
jgi:hypothetical protein